MNLYFSGITSESSLPEVALAKEAPCVMLTAWEILNKRRETLQRLEAYRDKKPGRSISSLFLDSGAHSLYTREVIRKKGVQAGEFYKGKGFKAYIKRYANLVKKFPVIDYYVNVDVIFNPELSWEVLKLIEDEYGLTPLPVIHHGTSLSWIERHINSGYKFIGLGGLGQKVTKHEYYAWADNVFNLLCPPPTRLPIVKIHGFAMTAFDLLSRYPWWSVDSASWVKSGGYGMVYVPSKRNGKFAFDLPPTVVVLSQDSPVIKKTKHFQHMRKEARNSVIDWLESIGVDANQATSHHAARKIANLHYFQRLSKSFPEWPWSFKPIRKKRFF